MAGNVFLAQVQIPRQLARGILDAAFEHARQQRMPPLTAVVLDGGGQLVVGEREDGCSPLRWAVANGKAYAALGVGVASGVTGERNAQRPAFLASVADAAQGRFVPVAGGVLILDEEQRIVGAVGVSGASSAEDQAAAIAGICAQGWQAGLQPGDDSAS
ncbi:GlcG/HbpS family heme-binding protein [Halomonas litopenaei]|uniref:GlcG/HbpS family heme-binding protein n=1 Tax=Halomonas litopenaei TaxID=2109328 RepID=UPI001A8E1E47|nr:heme-binding protein [Halomonas litopenaei]MBN8411598.1 heme-binding protein [Halomonas litopenaei]